VGLIIISLKINLFSHDMTECTMNIIYTNVKRYKINAWWLTLSDTRKLPFYISKYIINKWPTVSSFYDVCCSFGNIIDLYWRINVWSDFMESHTLYMYAYWIILYICYIVGLTNTSCCGLRLLQNTDKPPHVVASIKLSLVLKVTLFCHRKFHMNWTSFERSPVL